jgi:hypothetical protein
MLYGAVSFFFLFGPLGSSCSLGSIGPDFQTVYYSLFLFLGGEEGRLVVCHHNLIDFAEQQQQQQCIILAYVCVMCMCCVCVPKSAC